MALSNTAVPKYYGMFRDAVIRGEIPVCREIEMEMNRIDKQYLIVARGAAKSMYGSCLQNFFLNVDVTTTHQITTAPTMKQAEEVLSPIRTAITRSRGPFYKFLTEGSLQNTTGSKANRMKLASTKKGIENFLTGSLLEIRPMRIDKLQGLQLKVATVDEWLSGDIREDVIGAIEQGASKVNDYLIETIFWLSASDFLWRDTHITLHMKKLFHIAIEIIGRCHVLWEPIYHKATISVHSHFYFHCQMDRSVSKPETTFHHRLL